MRRSAVVPYHLQHLFPVELIFRERAGNRRQLRGRSVCFARENRGQRSCNPAPGIAVIGNPQNHEQAAEVGKSQAKCPVVIAASCNLGAGELGHDNGDLEHKRPEPDSVTEVVKQKLAGLCVVEPDQIE